MLDESIDAVYPAGSIVPPALHVPGSPMNEKQRRILFYAGLAIVAMLLYPPYTIRGASYVIHSGYAFLFSLPNRATVDVGTLLVQWLAAFIVGGIALLLSKDVR